MPRLFVLLQILILSQAFEFWTGADLSAQSMRPLKIGLFDDTRKVAQEARDKFFRNEATQKRFSAALQDAAQSPNNKLVLDDVMNSFFAEYNTSADSWLKRYRGVQIQFEDGMTPFEKAEYYSEMIGYLRDMQQEGISDDSRDGSKLDLKLHVYRSEQKMQELRDQWGPEVVDALNLSVPNQIDERDRSFRIKRLDEGNTDSIYWLNARPVFQKQDGKETLTIIRSDGEQMYHLPVEPSADLERLKKKIESQGNYRIPMYDASNPYLFYDARDQVESKDLGNEILVIAGENSSGFNKNEWVRFNSSKEEITAAERELFKKSQKVFINSPEQLAIAYLAADQKFNGAVSKARDQKAKKQADAILQKKRLDEQQEETAAQKEAKRILDSLKECPSGT